MFHADILFPRLVVMLAILVLFAGCGGSGADPSTAGTGGAETVAQKSPDQLKRDFDEQRRRIEAERVRQEERTRLRRSFVLVDFEQLDTDGRVVVNVSNPSDRDIDDIHGGFRVEAADGTLLAATGYTEGVPGDVFLAAGQTRSLRPFISRKEEVIERLSSDPDDVRFSFEAMGITYVDGTKQDGLADY